MLTKLFHFLRSQRLITIIAIDTTLISMGLALAALVKHSPVVMLVAAGVSGIAAGFAISAWHHSPRRKVDADRRVGPDRRDENHPKPQLMAQ
ncbi:MAG: hypothetical protein WBZ01_22030 [Terriglobales bacterium]|jgi:hypothetical protein